MRGMWLTRPKLPALASSIVKALVDEKLIETESPPGVQTDLLAVLEQYVRDEHDISTRRATSPPLAEHLRPRRAASARSSLASKAWGSVTTPWTTSSLSSSRC